MVAHNLFQLDLILVNRANLWAILYISRSSSKLPIKDVNRFISVIVFNGRYDYGLVT